MLFLSGLARSLVAPLVAAATAPWVCGKSSILSCASGHADSGSPGLNCPSTTRVSSTVREAEKLCRPLFVSGRPCRMSMDRLNRHPLLMSSLLRQEYLRRNSQHLLPVVLRVRATPPPPTQKTNIVRVVANPPKAFASPPEAVTSPPKLESDDVRSFDG